MEKSRLIEELKKADLFSRLESNELKDLVARFEASLNNGNGLFFDLDEFEDIIDYYIDFGLTQKARIALHHAFRIYPKSTKLHLKRAQILAFQNKRERALEILSEMEASEPENTDINLTKAHIYSQMQQYDKSIAEYIKASESEEQDQEDKDRQKLRPHQLHLKLRQSLAMK